MVELARELLAQPGKRSRLNISSHAISIIREAVQFFLAKKKGGKTWYKLMYKSPIPPYMFVSVLSMMREVADGVLPHPRPQ